MEGSESLSNDQILYAESIRAGKSVRLFVSIIYVIIVSISITMVLLDSQFILLSEVVIVSVTAAFILLYMNFRVLEITITDSWLDVRYGRFQRKTIPFTKMTDCEHIQISFKEYGGIGIRLGRDGTWAYNTTLGDAVKVTIIDERPFAFSTANPESVCEMLQELKG
ncbi:MAG: hypothetical protein ACFFFC_16220 [Candidatus Thorarchaeota archaeon]